MTLKLRAAKNSDLDALAELFLACRKDTFFWREPETLALEDFSAETRGEHITVAEDGAGQLLGFISVWLPDLFLHHLFVRSDRQNMGVGSALMEEVARSHPGRYRLKCVTKNRPALRFYEKHGWQHVETGFDDQDGEYRVLEWHHY